MTWYWYIGRPTELLLDLDSKRALWYAVQKLRRNIKRGFLDVQEVQLFPSIGAGHFHMLVLLENELPAIERAVWELQLGSDIKRAQYNIMRVLRGLKATNLLIVDRPYTGLWRVYDRVCDCPEKHKPRRITNHCPVLRELHGEEAGAEYFAIQRDRRKRVEAIRLPFGKVPLSTILKS